MALFPALRPLCVFILVLQICNFEEGFQGQVNIPNPEHGRVDTMTDACKT